MSRLQRGGEGSGSRGKPEKSQEATFLRLTLRVAFKEADVRETYEIHTSTLMREYENEIIKYYAAALMSSRLIAV